ncbi:CRISPR type I-F/YPEST-associated protein Csy2 [Delftia tsuruhatensis]|uniref:type I-F CRISPR-associated protein Csy2 n=1 Tax=Delftia tsuruhatensis TaxID=180282 RepID=UPI001E6C9CFD|nr:type I-F CRISPR-associated protein Csy2 [Delftia tsuruhatensis]CAB5718278.1 CRISPR type I-F/YPEST-associated protein Csy2 [Delftia tsuruhatensis]CAC9692430.1 CRISPR type I-F/YPEST-associated protein Csy2 [Delftia tsuruhatensis]
MTQAILTFPHLRVQNANAISSPLTHGFPSITAFTGLMWALERKLAQAGIPLRLHAVGVVCHHHQEQVTQGYVRSFNLTRNPVDKDGSTAAIVEEGRIHLDISLVFTVSEKRAAGTAATLVQGAGEQMQQWADKAGEVLSQMRVAGGSLLPTRAAPGRRVRPRLSVLAEDATERSRQFREWRRQWLPGFALVGRDDLLADRLQRLRAKAPQTTLLDAWLHAARFNHEPVAPEPGQPAPADGKQPWADPWRGPGSGWTVPIPVGYAALSPPHAAGEVLNSRDATTPLRFVESVYSLGEWISPHRLTHLEQLLWHAETDEARGLYRCRSGYAPDPAQIDGAADPADTGAQDDDDAYPYT